MRIGRREVLVAGAAMAMQASPRARAQGAGTLRLGVLNDASGPFRDTGGAISIACVRQAVQDFAAAGSGLAVEVVSADHQNRADVGAAIARQWFDRDGVDAIFDVPNSAVALAVNTVARERNKVLITSGAASTDLTGKQCTPNTVQWSYDTYMLGRSNAGPTVKLGGTTWYFITPDYSFGKSLQDSTARFVSEAGGKVLGSVLYPFPSTTDFSSFLLQASASGCKVIGLGTPGGDLASCVKQANEFGLPAQGIRLAGLGMLLPNVRALGLEASQGLLVTESFYWDMNDRTREVTARIGKATGGVPPCMTQAGNYAGALHYLKAAAGLGAQAAKADGAAAVARMKSMPTDDDCFGAASIRADGKALIPAYLFQVKAPAKSRSPWDYYELLATTPASDAWMPLSEGGCALAQNSPTP